MLYIFLAYYLFLLLLYRKKTVVVILTLLQILSLIAAFLIGIKIEINSLDDVFYCFLIIYVNTSVIKAWSNSSYIREITANDQRVDKLRKYFFVIMPFIWLILFIVAITVIILVGDSINDFKYGEGNSTDFYYTMLPINVKWYILVSILYQLAYFMFPFHFYYLSNRQYKYAIVSLFYSTSILLFGATFFSRWSIIQYFLLYITMFFICKNTIPPQIINIMKRVLIIMSTVFAIYFISISITRFEENTSYEETIPSDSKIQDPTVYSFCDYLGQSNRDGLEVLRRYNGVTMAGAYTFDVTRNVLSTFRILPYNRENFMLKRKMLFGPYAGGFTGLTAYSVMDYGILMTVFLFWLYSRYIRRRLRVSITFSDLCVIMIFVQIPICSIFYSLSSTVCFLYFCYSFLYLFLHYKRY